MSRQEGYETGNGRINRSFCIFHGCIGGWFFWLVFMVSVYVEAAGNHLSLSYD
jgi:hypothetical protein